jgi:hypothetical protein
MKCPINPEHDAMHSVGVLHPYHPAIECKSCDLEVLLTREQYSRFIKDELPWSELISNSDSLKKQINEATVEAGNVEL